MIEFNDSWRACLQASDAKQCGLKSGDSTETALLSATKALKVAKASA